ncbi:MAG: L-asparaginase [Phycisphaerales bacterium]|nr:L-asparaginase [Phycisphaerales bacterium]
MLSPAFRGAVCDVHNYAHPITLARRVAEQTPHTLIAGRGAEAFAAEHGFATNELLTESARQRYQQWLTERDTPPNAAGRLMPNFEEHPVAHAADRNDVHDTIGVLALDPKGALAAGCTTSGLPWKLPGRVGDSPIIGHGLYCDAHVGAAVLTGHGELVSGICGAFLAVELLRQGASPLDAARGVMERIYASFNLSERDQVGIIVMAQDGCFSSASLRPGFKVAVHSREQCALTGPDLVLLD